MKRMSNGAVLLLLLLFPIIIWAQDKTIVGKVADESGPIVGASVTVKNSTLGTTTDANGDFTLTVPPSAKTLVVSSLGYEPREVSISGNTFSITLQKSGASKLDEVVVVGYGTQRKANITG